MHWRWAKRVSSPHPPRSECRDSKGGGVHPMSLAALRHFGSRLNCIQQPLQFGLSALAEGLTKIDHQGSIHHNF